jgi:hypothetical protein
MRLLCTSIASVMLRVEGVLHSKCVREAALVSVLMMSLSVLFSVPFRCLYLEGKERKGKARVLHTKVDLLSLPVSQPPTHTTTTEGETCMQSLTKLLAGSTLARALSRPVASKAMSTVTLQATPASLFVAATLRGGAAQQARDEDEGLQRAYEPGHILKGPQYEAKVATMRRLLSKAHGVNGGGAAGLQIVTDFDLTLTAPGSVQCHHMFGR